jgi:RNA recognition motif-containing protein
MPYGVHINGYRCSDLNADGTEVKSNIIFAGGLTPSTTKQELSRYFEKYGRIQECAVVQKGRHPGFGFVTFERQSSCDKAVAAGMHQLFGRWIEVRKAVPESRTGPVVPSTGPSASLRRDWGDRCSWNDGSRSMREQIMQELKAKGEVGKSKRSSSSSSSSSTSSSSAKKAKKKKKQKRRQSARSISSDSSSVNVTGGAGTAARITALNKDSGSSDPALDQAKKEGLDRLLQIKGMPNKDDRLKAWRALLRAWHPDKNPERTEVATAVFQFLQKGKPMVDDD